MTMKKHCTQILLINCEIRKRRAYASVKSLGSPKLSMDYFIVQCFLLNQYLLNQQIGFLLLVERK